jgi:hypothetical protein
MLARAPQVSLMANQRHGLRWKLSAIMLLRWPHNRNGRSIVASDDDDGAALVEPADGVEQEWAAGLGKRKVTAFVQDDEVHPEHRAFRTSSAGRTHWCSGRPTITALSRQSLAMTSSRWASSERSGHVSRLLTWEA